MGSTAKFTPLNADSSSSQVGSTESGLCCLVPRFVLDLWGQVATSSCHVFFHLRAVLAVQCLLACVLASVLVLFGIAPMLNKQEQR